ncbi:MAG: sensor histidine kinase [Pseudomonadota bacterium]
MTDQRASTQTDPPKPEPLSPTSWKRRLNFKDRPFQFFDQSTLQEKLLWTLTAALTPVLIFAGFQAYFDAQNSMAERREELIILSDQANDKVEQAIKSAELLLYSFRDEIAEGRCDYAYNSIRELLPFVVKIASFDGDRNQSCSVPVDIEQTNLYTDNIKDNQSTDQLFYLNSMFIPALEEWVFLLNHDVGIEDDTDIQHMVLGLSITQLITSEAFRSPYEGMEIAIVNDNGIVFGSQLNTEVDKDLLNRAQTKNDTVIGIYEDDSGQHYDRILSPVRGQDIFMMSSRPSPGILSEFTLRPATVVGIPVMVFLVALIAVWFAVDRSVLKWFRPLRRMAVAFAGGNYNYKAGNDFAKAPPEIQRLSTTLERMADRIGARDKELRKAIDTRDAAVKEIHHRVKNNLQIVTSFVSLQTRAVKDNESKRVLSAVRHRIDALSIVHQTLYRHERLETVHMQPFFDALLYHLRDALGMEEDNVALIWNIDEVERHSDDAIPIALFVLEAVTNAMKYAFDINGGTIWVDLKSTEKNIVLNIQDNGAGADTKTSIGLGSKLMQAFARQLRANHQHGTNEKGYWVELQIPHRKI